MAKRLITGYFAASYIACGFALMASSGSLSSIFFFIASMYFILSTFGKLPEGIDVKTWKSAIAFGIAGIVFGTLLILFPDDSGSAITMTVVLLCVGAYIAFEIFCYNYFNSAEFEDIKDSIQGYVKNCNELNRHIQGLKNSYVNIKSFNYGLGEIEDNSRYNFKRNEWKNFTQGSRIHNCSASVLNNVRSQPIKYLCKYFDIKTTEESLSSIEEVLNAFSAAEQGKQLLANERDSIIDSISNSVPWIIKNLAKNRLSRKLGFEIIDLSDLYFPVYRFQYVSAGGNSSAKFEIKLDVLNLESLVNYLGDLVKFRKSIQGQRALMTTRLREQIKIRDNYSCQICDLSVEDEPNLLLEIDHIVPVSKGGITSVDNLQTLCWRCNRSKGAKV